MRGHLLNDKLCAFERFIRNRLCRPIFDSVLLDDFLLGRISPSTNQQNGKE